MQILLSFSGYSHSVIFLQLMLVLYSHGHGAYGFGRMGPISASFGNDEFFCAIDASGKQNVICWGINSTLSVPAYSMAALSGGEGFICGILANTSQAYCWSARNSSIDLVPPPYKNTSYSRIAAGKNHVCAIRGFYYVDYDSGMVDCWEVSKSGNNTMSSKQSELYYDQSTSRLELNKIVSGEGFTCGSVKEGGLVCWGPNSTTLGVSNVSENFALLTSGRNSICGILNVSRDLKCWGDANSFVDPPVEVKLVTVSVGAHHFCGIRADNHLVECWGSFNTSVAPKASGFIAIASSDYTTCGIREDDLLLDCWLVNASKPDFDPPLELSSPGLCSVSSCSEGKFAFNVSLLNEPDLTSLCVRKDLRICLPCGSNCSEGFFLSSPCTAHADMVCTACSLCQNSSCWEVCRPQSFSKIHRNSWHHSHRLWIIIGSSALGLLLLLTCGCLSQRLIATRKSQENKNQSKGKLEQENDNNFGLHSSPSTGSCPGMPQIFRLPELKDATNGFKEFNELGRGGYGFVYKAVLADGRVVAVKRANAATIIHTNNRDFEMELEILCKIRHGNVVNLLGYCADMGERLLVYEYMPHGTLYDHLHGGLSPLNWSLRLKISMQAAKGLEYLHKELVPPPVVHRDIKSSNILLDSEWGARIADFGLLTPSDKDFNGDPRSDVYSFGIVLLEILSGRKARDRDFTPPNIVEWAVPLIKRGKAAAIIDRYVALPRNVEPLLKLAEIAELAVRENPSERPSMSDVAFRLEQIVKDGLI